MNLARARTILFVPGDRPERYASAVAAGADAVVLDLEDAVRANRKDDARAEACRWLADGNQACVRINAAGTAFHQADLAALCTARGLAGVLLPKARDPTVATTTHRALGVPVLAIVETADGVLAAADLASAEGVVRLALGALDLGVDLDTDDPGTFARVRTRLLLASRAAGLEGPVDSVTSNITDAEVAGRDARAAKAVGMQGKLCIHPRQVDPVRVAFTPGEQEIEWARHILEAGASGGVSVVDGRMVDEPVLERARRILDRA